MTKERIEDIRQSVIPFIKKVLLEINNNGRGEFDAKEFEKELNEALDMVIKALEQQPSEDCVSRKAVIDMAKSYNTDGYDSYTPLVVDVEDIEALPPVTPTHGTCKDCNKQVICKIISKSKSDNWYCADFERREG